jgi:catechol 2,3-dioxygenase-like lactoylglutathione lyase family enzyme
VLASRDASGAGLGPKDAPVLWLSTAKQERKTGTHIAFRAADRASVDRFYAAGLKSGGKDNGRPGLRPDYGATYYAAFLIDPDGNNVEAVCT